MRTLTFTVAPEDDARRLGRLAQTRLSLSTKQLSRARYAGRLLLDGAPAHADARVRTGQTVAVVLEDDAPAFVPKPCPLPVDIVYEDEDLYVVNKSAPMATQSSPGQADDALENRLMARFNDPGFIFRPVNRLDRGTSGLMAAAKNAHAQALLNGMLHTEGFIREYLAVTEGVPDPGSGTIDAPIGRLPGESVRRGVTPDGKKSVTHYRTVETSGGRALLRLRLETGRTHQIRVHTAHIGCPVCGDYIYGTPINELGERFALHSCRLRFTHPLSGRTIDLEAELPEALEKLMSKNTRSATTA